MTPLRRLAVLAALLPAAMALGSLVGVLLCEVNLRKINAEWDAAGVQP